MFRKIVSNLNYSPALVGQLGFYAKRLRKEEATRRLGLVFTALALVVQSLAVFSPPEAANAASTADFITGGVKNQEEYLKHYERNTNDLKDIYNSLGITRAEIAAAKKTTIRETGGYFNWSPKSLYSHAQGQRAWNYDKASGGKGTAFYRPMTLSQGGPVHTVYVGHSKVFGWFAYKKECGNIVTKTPPSSPDPTAACQSLRIQTLAPDRFRVTTQAKKKDGAEIREYRYEIKRGGTVVASPTYKDKTESHSFVYNQSSPGTYSVKVTLATSLGQKTSANCKDSFVVDSKPTAACVGLTASITNKTSVALRGSARTANGATIRSYTFVVKNSSGKEVKKVTVTSTRNDVSAESFSLPPGSYVASLTVTTSVGSKTSAECAKPFTVQKPEVCAYNPTLPPNSPDCQPCPDNPEIWIKDADCNADVINTKLATNMTQGNINATTTRAKSDDKISYTLTVQNSGLASDKVTMSESLGDVLQYAKLIDMGGGTFDEATKTLSWPAFTLNAGEKQSRVIAVQMLSPIPATNTGLSDSDSYDCKMVNTFGNAIEVNVECAAQKVVVEQVVGELPQTGATENMIFAGVVLSIVAYFYARSRQLGREVRLIRRDLNTGTI